MENWLEAKWDMEQAGEASPFYMQVVEEMRSIDPSINPTREDVMKYVDSRLAENEGTMQAGPPKSGFLQDVGPAMKWLFEKMKNPNVNPYGWRSPSKGGAAGAIQGGIDRMTD